MLMVKEKIGQMESFKLTWSVYLEEQIAKFK